VLPGRSGLEVCREIRRVSTTPVIMVTARADSADVIAGLEAGADDYVTKPFVAEELSARIRALARRAGTAGPRPRIVVGDLQIAPADGVVTRGGEVVPLTRTEFKLLLELAPLLAEVAEVLAPRVFTVTSPEDAEVGPVLVVATQDAGDADPQAGTPFIVAATPVASSDATVVTEEFSLDVDPAQLAQWGDQAYLVAEVLAPAP
jgi:CheY-like chemotaxis protein